MKHGSLFSGIGGFDLAAKWAGWENIFQVEIDSWCQKILQKNFPDVQIFSDIRDFDGTAWRGSVDIISGGFPCQPYSSAGKRLGTDDERHLWPEMLRVIREASPRWVVGENVRGIVNWSGGLVFEKVCADLESSGYKVQPFLLPAAGVGAPHERYRTWFVAHAEGNGKTEQHLRKAAGIKIPPERHTFRFDNKRDAANAEDFRRQWSGIARIRRDGFEDWTDWPTQSPVCGRNDGIPNRVDRIRGLGNSVVPQVVYNIFKSINEYEAL